MSSGGRSSGLLVGYEADLDADWIREWHTLFNYGDCSRGEFDDFPVRLSGWTASEPSAAAILGLSGDKSLLDLMLRRHRPPDVVIEPAPAASGQMLPLMPRSAPSPCSKTQAGR